MRLIKLFFILVYFVAIFVFIVLGVWSSIAGTEFSLFPYFYWLILIGLIFIAFTRHINSSVFFIIAIVFFVISFSISAIGFSDVGEFLSKVNFVIFTVALLKAIVEYIRHDHI